MTWPACDVRVIFRLSSKRLSLWEVAVSVANIRRSETHWRFASLIRTPDWHFLAVAAIVHRQPFFRGRPMFDFENPERYAVMGNPVSHSLSPVIHQQFASQFKERIEYSAIQVDPGGFEQAVAQFRANGGRGLNVTVPFKLEAYRLADMITPLAQEAQAANTLRFLDDGAIEAHNTDGLGLMRDLMRLLGLSYGRAGADTVGLAFQSRDILVVGAGGAVRGVLGPLLRQSPRLLVVANRTVDRARELAEKFAIQACALDRLAEVGRSGFDIVINGTSASLHGEMPPLPNGLFKSDAIAYDMMYGKKPTSFMQWASQQGVTRVSDGLGMLVEQAAESFYFWRGKHPDTEPVLKILRQR